MAQRTRSLWPGLWALLVAALVAGPALGQSRSYPGQRHFAAWDELHSADYRRAERVFRTELRSGVKTIDSRWLDSICYAAGLGEALYQQGRLAESLQQFDGAVDLFLDQATWMRRVRFQQAPREDTSIARRLPPWAAPSRPTVYADVPRSFLYQYGQLDNSAVRQQGGVVQQAQYWKLDCEETARAIAWTLYRRGDLLGPLGAYDARTQAVKTRLAGGGLGPANWTSAWVELWWGLAQGASGDGVGALPHLQNAALLGGQMQHRLTGLSLLAQGRLAMGQGDSAAAAELLRESISSATAYEELSVLAEATRALHELSTADPAASPPPLAAIADWTQRGGAWRVALDAQLAIIERALIDGQSAAAEKSLGTLFRRARDASTGWMGREAERLAAIAACETQPYSRALAQAQRAVAAQQAVSRRLFQVRLANDWFDDGRLSKRLARQAYVELLGDPSGIAWQLAPLDALASVASPEVGALERWFDAALDRRDPLEALRVVDQHRRREYFAGQPLGGRQVSARWLLEAPDEALPRQGLEARNRVDASAPEYRNLRRDGLLAEQAMREAIASAEDDSNTPALRKAEKEFADTLAARERIVLRTALSRVAAPMAFPPPIDPIAAKGALAEGEAVLVFHEHLDDLYGLVLTAQGEHLWRVGASKQVEQRVERLLREVVGTSSKQKWSHESLTTGEWEEAAGELSDLLLADSRLDSSTLDRLWVVPVGSLWRAPFGALTLGGAGGKRLGDVALSVAPTPGWAVRPHLEAEGIFASDPIWKVGAANAGTLEVDGLDPLVAVAQATEPPRGFEASVPNLKAVAARAILDLGGRPVGIDPLGTVVTTASKGQREVAVWNRLPWAETRAIAVRGLGGGEAGGASVRRSKGAVTLGAPEFHVVSSLLAGGAETVLLERWPTGGVRSHEFVAEWLNGLGRLSPTEAWSRSLALGRSAPIDVPREPRYEPDEAGESQSLSADHPVWWSGYLLVD